jgi:hypothetical protein
MIFVGKNKYPKIIKFFTLFYDIINLHKKFCTVLIIFNYPLNYKPLIN